MTATLTNITKNTGAMSGIGKTFNGVYGIARYGVSTYGTGVAGGGLLTNTSKNTGVITNIIKN